AGEDRIGTFAPQAGLKFTADFGEAALGSVLTGDDPGQAAGLGHPEGFADGADRVAEHRVIEDFGESAAFDPTEITAFITAGAFAAAGDRSAERRFITRHEFRP